MEVLMPFAGKRLKAVDVARLAHEAGVPIGDKLAVAVAVCKGESLFWTKAWNFNKKTRDRSFGLWQINMLGGLEKERLALYRLDSVEDLFKPDVNASIMAKMSRNGKNWAPWGAYWNGSFRKYMPEAWKGVDALNGARVPRTPYVPPPFPVGLKPNSSVPSARDLQRALKAAGYLPDAVAEAANYGPYTQAAVVNFHKRHPEFRAMGVANDPYIGPLGWAELHREAYG